ncbi:uncharacterized protein PHACADRAFT_258105 [Phanerochaete carnosa HHB-10118-sp]|uniref:Uncharacterized protein n=1 Tax=Phanerochaete carnosa (strain HHB-10118-sp) TaxID=650164 RepID=K5VS78_PHACS|nr:uncharacterized protein PHACADRAFT_258105 [Phanerochaete carnosa HHB-10118-sp]EKM54323.1 hypothetical protein PHACADRAFT_258105 [Phanerochaete carnosa HHB-10118-sp]
MSQSGTFRFPAPIGGVPLAHDFAPCILFACLYGALAFLCFYRLAKNASRNVFVLSVLVFIIERVVIWSLRAKQARMPSEDLNRHLTTYFQITFSIGFLTIHSLIIHLLRCPVVGTTIDTSSTPESSLWSKSEEVGGLSASASKSKTSVAVLPLEYEAREDQPQKRALYRRVFSILSLQFLIPIIVGAVMGNEYVDTETDAAKVPAVQALRYVTAAMGLILTLLVLALLIWAILMVPRIKRNAVILLFALETILTMIPIYHLVVMANSTTSLTSTASGSQNTPGEKAAFYVFQALAEFAPCVVLLTINMKTMFGTGYFGDRLMDPKKKPEPAPTAQEAT